jgi:hypothetical protein
LREPYVRCDHIEWCIICLGPYLLVITERERVGNAIWKITRTQVLPFMQDYRHLSEGQVKGRAINEKRVS